MTDINIADAPHILIAGTTGSGKSVLLNHFIQQIVDAPQDKFTQFIFIDPKRVDLRKWSKLARNTIYADNPRDAERALRGVSIAMEKRYKELIKKKQTTIIGNYMFVVIDELADLFLSDYGKYIKKELQHILQLGRAANIHVIAATQAPNRKIIPAELVLNFTHRVALRCISPIESRQIIGIAGAENLPQYGKALVLTPEGLTSIIIPPPA